MKRYLPAVGLLAAVVCSVAYAASARTVVSASSLRTAMITITVQGKTEHKTIYCLKKTPGAAKVVRGGKLFTPYSATIAQLKTNKIGGKQLATYTQLNKVGKTTCTRLASSGGGSSSSSSRSSGSSSSSSRPKATPTPTSVLNFDNNGNLTPKGKAAFGVPSNLNGNISAGASLYADYCTCHNPPLNQNFSNVRGIIAGPPASFTSSEITDPMLANIIAYLNRFNL